MLLINDQFSLNVKIKKKRGGGQRNVQYQIKLPCTGMSQKNKPE